MDDNLAAALREVNLLPEDFSQKTNTVYSGQLSAGVNRVETWLSLMKAAPRSGYYPVLRGDPEAIYNGYHSDPQSILAKAPAGPLIELLQPFTATRIESLQRIGEMFPAIAEELSLEQDPMDIDRLARSVDLSGINSFGGKRSPQAEWPATVPKETKIKFHTISGLKDKPCGLSLVKASKGYEVFAHIEFEPGESGFYTPELLVAIFREWRDQFKAAPAVITGDTLECIVLQPPSSEEECLKLAARQWIFCDDIVGQGTQSVRNLAIELCSHKTWFFWWD